MDGDAEQPDALLDQLDDYMNGRVKEEDEDEACDSQLTEYDDDHWPAEPPPKRQRCTSPPRHFTKSNEFWDSVAKEVRYYMDDEWFSTADKTINDLSEDWERNVSTVARAINSIALGSRQFKIGICRDPKWRWFVCNGGKYSKEFTKMTIVILVNSLLYFPPLHTNQRHFGSRQIPILNCLDPSAMELMALATVETLRSQSSLKSLMVLSAVENHSSSM